jgi:amino acid permease
VTLTETFGATVLALPIAVAGPGPIPGLVALVVLGVINMMTLAAFVEVFSRDGGVPSGRVFLGGLVESYLGKPVSVAIRVLLLALLMLLLSVYYIGVGTTVGDELPVSPVLVAALMFVAGLAFLSQDSLARWCLHPSS